MRSVLEFVSTLAVGLFAAAVIAAGSQQMLPGGITGSGRARLDYGSIGLGVVAGVLASTIIRVGWSDLPRRAVGYILSKRGTFRLMGWGAVFAAVLLLY